MNRETYESKRCSLEAAVGLIESNQRIVMSPGSVEPLEIVDLLPSIADRVKNVTLTTMLSMKLHEIYTNPKCADSFRVESSFYSMPLRIASKNRVSEFIPSHLRNVGPLCSQKRTDILFTMVSPMDKYGYFSMGCTGSIMQYDILKNVDKVVALVNPQMPRTFGDTAIHLDQIDYICEIDRPLLTLPEPTLTEEDMKIGSYISELIEDGSTIQLGIGAITNAAALQLKNKKNLGIHTEMLSDAMVELCKAGAVNGSQKTLHPNKIVTVFTLGSKKSYDFIDDNPAVLHLRCSYTNNPSVIAKNDKMISVNTTIQIDLLGQCASETVGLQQISGTGGQVETAIGAQMAKGGKSIMALRSTAEIKKKGSEEKVTVSKIVPFLDPGTVVTMTRTDVDYVVTEYGIARLKGATVSERVKRLIEIAHPDFRETLTETAKSNYLI